MQTKKLQAGFQLPELGLGTWAIGGERSVDHSRDTEWIDLIKTAVALGYSHIDTASMYGIGHAEELIGEAIRDMQRADLTIATKVFATELSYDRFIASAKASMSRLNVAYVDLLYIHAPNPEIPLAETMRALDFLVAEGSVKNIAVSNFTADLLREAQSHTKNKIVANQVEYNLRTRKTSRYGDCTNMESDLLPYCQQHDVLLVAYRPIDRGTILEPSDVIDAMCEKYGKTRAQVAINWLVSQSNVVTIAKSDNVAHLKENLEAVDWRMEPTDIEILRTEYPSDRN